MGGCLARCCDHCRAVCGRQTCDQPLHWQQQHGIDFWGGKRPDHRLCLGLLFGPDLSSRGRIRESLWGYETIHQLIAWFRSLSLNRNLSIKQLFLTPVIPAARTKDTTCQFSHAERDDANLCHTLWLRLTIS